MDIQNAMMVIYPVQLLFDKEVNLDSAALLTSLKELGLNVTETKLEKGEKDESRSFSAFKINEVEVDLGGKKVAPLLLFTPEASLKDLAGVQGALDQSWDFDKENIDVRGLSHSILVSDMFSHSQPHIERMDNIRKAVLAVLDQADCQAIYWQPSNHFLSPEKFLQVQSQPDYNWIFAGFVNVRMFNIQNKPGDLLMDTLGLTAMGLADLQCHFRKLDPNDIAAKLFDTAYYIFSNGMVIEDGNTIGGLRPKDKWKCHYEKSLIGPDRIVIDINPGRKYAAGKR
ncbi:MAG: DUF4261 domain-containing protein [Anaerolineae bacterium]|nr:DUF4261 domain-containing protein [Anaerolineae bacterium]